MFVIIIITSHCAQRPPTTNVSQATTACCHFNQRLIIGYGNSKISYDYEIIRVSQHWTEWWSLQSTDGIIWATVHCYYDNTYTTHNPIHYTQVTQPSSQDTCQMSIFFPFPCIYCTKSTISNYILNGIAFLNNHIFFFLFCNKIYEQDDNHKGFAVTRVQSVEYTQYAQYT